jgi:hypothetical protein
VLGYFPGKVYLTPNKNGGLFLRPEESAVLADIIEQVENEPTVAGPELDTTRLSELRQLLTSAGISLSEDEPPTVLSGDLALYLEIILLQPEVKMSLAPKLSYRCKDCLKEWTEDQSELLRRQAEARAQEQSASLNDVFRIENQAHSHHRFGTILATGIALARPRISFGITCSNCGNCRDDGFVVRSFTFCPGCGEHRYETVLLRCPNPTCSYVYSERARSPVWVPASEAIDDFKMHWKLTTIINTVGSWEGTGPGQITDLVKEISPDEKLIGIARFSSFNGLKRNVIVLFTSEKLVWTVRRLVLWSDRYGRAWDQILEISAAGDGQHELRVTLTNGSVARLGAFTGTGMGLNGGNPRFGPDEINRVTRKILRASE